MAEIYEKKLKLKKEWNAKNKQRTAEYNKLYYQKIKNSYDAKKNNVFISSKENKDQNGVAGTAGIAQKNNISEQHVNNNKIILSPFVSIPNNNIHIINKQPARNADNNNNNMNLVNKQQVRNSDNKNSILTPPIQNTDRVDNNNNNNNNYYLAKDKVMIGGATKNIDIILDINKLYDQIYQNIYQDAYNIAYKNAREDIENKLKKSMRNNFQNQKILHENNTKYDKKKYNLKPTLKKITYDK